MEAEFFQKNRRRVFDELPEGSMAVVFAGGYRQRSEDDNYDYTANRNYYYLTGQKNIGGILILVKTARDCQEYLLTERQTYKNKLYKGTFPTERQYREWTLIPNILYLDQFYATVSGIISKCHISSLFLDLNRFSLDDSVTETEGFAGRIKTAYPCMRIENLRPIVCNLRRVKNPQEQEIMKRCARMTAEGVSALVKKIRPGVYTYSLYAEFDYYLKYNYGEPHSFQSVVTTGRDCLSLHDFEHYAQVQDGDLVLVDLGAECEYYASDICRMYPANGTYTEDQRYFYQAVIDAEEAVASHLKPGFDMREIPAIADAVLCDRLRRRGLIRQDSEIHRYLDHGIYHFVGLDAHDVGDICQLEPGMVVSVEPGLYLQELGIGVRVEDNYLITENGNINLTENISKFPKEIERQMKQNGV